MKEQNRVNEKKNKKQKWKQRERKWAREQPWRVRTQGDSISKPKPAELKMVKKRRAQKND